MPETKLPAPGVGEPTVLLPSWRLHLEAPSLFPRTIRAYTDDGALLAAFLAAGGTPTAVLSIRREHVEAFIVAELERTSPASAATRYRSLQQLFNWLADEGEIEASPMAKMRPLKIPARPVPVLSDHHVRLLLANCSGKDFRNRRDSAIIRLFLDTGMRLEGMSGLQYDADDPESSDVGLTSRAARITAKDRRELVLPIGSEDRSRHRPIPPRAGRSSSRGRPVAVARQEGPPHGERTHGERRLPDDQGSGQMRLGSRSSSPPATRG